jgi:hypothetical protein
MRELRLLSWWLVHREWKSKSLLGFLRGERGVVTVEWVALAAGLTVGAIYISFIVMHGLIAPASNIAKQLTP